MSDVRRTLWARALIVNDDFLPEPWIRDMAGTQEECISLGKFLRESVQPLAKNPLIPVIKILMIGAPGAGKSALVISMISQRDDTKLFSGPHAASSHEHTVTKHITHYDMALPGDGHRVSVCIVDMPGVERGMEYDKPEFRVDALSGKLQNGYRVRNERDDEVVGDQSDKINPQPTVADRVNAVNFVISISTLLEAMSESPTESTQRKMQMLMEWKETIEATSPEVPIFVTVTNVDAMVPAARQHLFSVAHSKLCRDAYNFLSKTFETDNIRFVRNYKPQDRILGASMRDWQRDYMLRALLKLIVDHALRHLIDLHECEQEADEAARPPKDVVQQQLMQLKDSVEDEWADEDQAPKPTDGEIMDALRKSRYTVPAAMCMLRTTGAERRVAAIAAAAAGTACC